MLAADLDSETTTCVGAERAGSDEDFAACTGWFLRTWPGQTCPQGHEPGPYAAEVPLFEVGASNQARYAAALTAGQKALLRQYPDAFRMKAAATSASRTGSATRSSATRSRRA